MCVGLKGLGLKGPKPPGTHLEVAVGDPPVAEVGDPLQLRYTVGGGGGEEECVGGGGVRNGGEKERDRLGYVYA